MRLKKLTVFAITAALCAGTFAAGCGRIEEAQEEPVETEEETAEAAAEEEPEQEEEPEPEEPEAALQEVGDPSSSIEVLMTNDMGSDVSGLAVKAPGEAEYPDNMLEDDQMIADGETVEFFYEPAGSEDSEEADEPCSLQVTLEDGSIYELHNFDLEDLSEVELCLQDDVAYLKYVSLAKKITINTIDIELAYIEEMEAAQALNDRIAAFGEVTSENKEEVKSIREAYDAMTADQKAAVTNEALLEDLEAAVASIEEEEAAAQAAAEQAAAEQAAAEQAAAEQAAAEQAAAEQAAAEEAAAQASSGFSFADIGGQYFGFSSGAGAWSTDMTVNSDGTFYGQFHDSNWMEINISNYSGKFSAPTKINDYTYSTYVEYLTYAQTPGTQEEIDGVLYSYDTAYGVSEGATFYIYLPGTPVSEIPGAVTEFRPGVFSGMSTTDRYVLYSVTDAAGFM